MMSNPWSKRAGAIAIFLWLSGCPDSFGANPGAAERGKKNGPAADDVSAALAPDASVDCPDGADAGAGAGPRLEGRTLSLWPPNHKFHDISVADCVAVQNDCGGPFHGEFLWASSDEPIDDKGDGHHAPDILVSEDCERVSVRSERQGPKDGRVYKLGVRVVDGDGNASEATCTIVVDHDQRGVVAADSGESYRVTFDGSAGNPACDGEPDEPPPPPPPGDDDPEPEPDAGPGPG